MRKVTATHVSDLHSRFTDLDGPDGRKAMATDSTQ